ncbi:MAG TPA: hypothetical protein DIW81_26385 [Planctomycetaceae bacterium]|nr:hypothetical protein [Rubinisphaera sp.]HCS55069.1 hypothetical protein [Planctomycetaceae bacterium]
MILFPLTTLIVFSITKQAVDFFDYFNINDVRKAILFESPKKDSSVEFCRSVFSVSGDKK